MLKNKYIYTAVLWGLAFLVTCFVNLEDGGMNPASRIAALRSIVTNGNFQIDQNIDTTIDWAKAPDRHYYSNKAPGGILLAAPFFAVLDWLDWKIYFKGEGNWKNRPLPSRYARIALAVCTQAIPFILIFLFFISISGAQSVTQVSALALSLLFANTASIFMSTNFGHGLCAMFFFACVVALLKERFFYSGLFFGLSFLSDYSGIALILPFVTGLISQHKNKKSIYFALLGTLIPAILWISYHWICFGSPLAIAHQFQNPKFITPHDNDSIKFFGEMDLFPNFDILFELFLGSIRGMFWIMPWIFVTLFLSFKKFRTLSVNAKKILYISSSGLISLLWLNGSFVGWHGGGSPGPRYLSAIFPVLSLTLYYIYPYLKKSELKVLWASIIISVFFQCLALSSTILAKEEPIWIFYLGQLFITPPFKPMIRLALYIIILLTSWLMINKKKSLPPPIKN